MKTNKYKYVSSTLSRHTLRSLDRHLVKIGEIKTIRAMYSDRTWYRLIVTGTTGRLVLRGCSWGYGGEGPQATEAALRRLLAGTNVEAVIYGIVFNPKFASRADQEVCKQTEYFGFYKLDGATLWSYSTPCTNVAA